MKTNPNHPNIHVVLVGPPGCGKTKLKQFFINCLIKEKIYIGLADEHSFRVDSNKFLLWTELMKQVNKNKK